MTNRIDWGFGEYANDILIEDVQEDLLPDIISYEMKARKKEEEWILKFLCYEDATPGSMVPLFQNRERTYTTKDLQRNAEFLFGKGIPKQAVATNVGIILRRCIPGVVKKNVTTKRVPVYVLPEDALALTCNELGVQVSTAQLKYLGY